MEKLKIGILGASRGMDFAMRILPGYEFAEIKAVCETYPDLLEKSRAFFREKGERVLCTQSFDEMLDAGIDAVIVANYANEHAPYAIRALEKGVHVYSEVQPVQTLAEACALCDAAEKSGKIYAYGENYCYFDNVFAMKRHYEAGDIGEAVCLEGNFINDCAPKWHLLTRGKRDHWRNYVPSSFYCTHSIGPILFSTSLSPVRVTGLEAPRLPSMAEKGARCGGGAFLSMELKNGGIARSLNSNGLKHPYVAFYRLIGENGSIEATADRITIYRYDREFRFDVREETDSFPDFPYRPRLELGHVSNSDATAFGFFVARILGDPVGIKNSIDVYRALDMALPGLLGYRSILKGGAPFEIPDLRDPAARDKYRNDFYATDPRTPAPWLLPTSKAGTPEVEESVYEAVREELEKVDLTPGMK
ncbi:MAG: Gfo/Idh/MocA family oxidoreductase [Clostridia bacterium]|nr:Gfo/Idh/MocA family oxidoreductase [Clostridia bacterium]